MEKELELIMNKGRKSNVATRNDHDILTIMNLGINIKRRQICQTMTAAWDGCDHRQSFSCAAQKICRLQNAISVFKLWYFCIMNTLPATIRFQELSELDTVAASLLRIGENVPVWLFSGSMGVGKTTLIKKLCELLGVKSIVQSPTFSLVNEYITQKGVLVYHFDFYRIRSEIEALDIGIEEYFDSGGFCFVEWPEKIESLWPYPHLLITMDMDENGHRVLVVTEEKQ